MNTELIARVLTALRPQGWTMEGDNAFENVTIWEGDGPAPTREEFDAKVAEISPIYYMEKLREERNKRLAETDWWALSDITMTDEERAYRESLRDLPANTSDPANPVWPTKPT
jgi:hypothetical protein|tara:strand:- start:6 stop:344 length:339 start_codon:yes stop_codon:yes gene_type:complete